MTVVRPKSPGSSGYGSSSSTSRPMSNRAKAALRGVGLAALSAIATFVFPVTFGSLATSMLAGLVIGWVRTAWSIKNRLGASFISALFGKSLDRGDRTTVAIDVAISTCVGFAVGLAFAGFRWLDLQPDSAIQLVVFGAGGSGGAGGGAGPDGLSMLVALIFVALVFALVGLLAASAAYSIEVPYLQTLEKTVTTGAGKSIVKDASIRIVDRDATRRPLVAVALQGAVTALLTALIHRLLIG